jgi:hypothetical protein
MSNTKVIETSSESEEALELMTKVQRTFDEVSNYMASYIDGDYTSEQYQRVYWAYRREAERATSTYQVRAAVHGVLDAVELRIEENFREQSCFGQSCESAVREVSLPKPKDDKPMVVKVTDAVATCIQFSFLTVLYGAMGGSVILAIVTAIAFLV